MALTQAVTIHYEHVPDIGNDHGLAIGKRLEANPRTRDQIVDGARRQDLSRLGQFGEPVRNFDQRTSNTGAVDLHLSYLDSGAQAGTATYCGTDRAGITD